MKKPLKIAVAVAIANIGMLHTTGALAGGTSFTEQGASGLGNSYAGMSSAAEDASVYYWNPAALTRFKKAELVGGLLVAQLYTPYTNSSTPPCSDATFTPNVKSEQQAASRTPCAANDPNRAGEPGKTYERSKPARVAIPFNFAAIPLNERTVLGFGVSGSSGLIVRYPSDSPGRTQAESTDLKVVRLSGGMGYKLTPTFSIGGSFGYERMFTSIRLRVNFRDASSRFLQQQGSPRDLARGVTNANISEAEEETSARITVYGWAVNGQIGGLWEPSETTRVGFGYRPKTTFENQGQLVIDSIPRSLQPGGALRDSGQVPPNLAVLLNNFQEVRQRITLPSEFNVSAFHSFTPKLDLMASYLREDFTDTRIDFRTANNDVIQNPRQDFQVTQRYAIGGNYKYAKRLTLRAGFAKENSAVKDENRLQSLPDNDRTFFNVGARWKIDRSMMLDVGYQRINFKEGAVGLNPQTTDAVFNGKIKVNVDIIGIQLVDQF